MATTATPSDTSMDKPTLFRSRRIMVWEIGGIFFINFIGGALHFAFELSNYSRAVALFASVNESTWEHLKFYFWASLLFALIEYTYIRKEANNFAFAKALSFVTMLFTIALLFYAYVGIMVPLYGQGTYLGVVLIGVLGVIFSQIVGSYFLQTRPLGQLYRYVGIGIIIVLTIMFLLFTFFPPEVFLFEDFFGYEYNGQYGILEDYEPYRVFGSETSAGD
jgi:hypothetical protein